jgi:hypothetical protein
MSPKNLPTLHAFDIPGGDIAVGGSASDDDPFPVTAGGVLDETFDGVEGGDSECAETEGEAEVPEVEDSACCSEEEPGLFLRVEEEGCRGAVVGWILEV